MTYTYERHDPLRLCYCIILMLVKRMEIEPNIFSTSAKDFSGNNNNVQVMRLASPLCYRPCVS